MKLTSCNSPPEDCNHGSLDKEQVRTAGREKNRCVSGWRGQLLHHGCLTCRRQGQYSEDCRTQAKRHLGGDEASTYKPQDCLTGAAIFKRNHIANFMTNVNIHFVGYPQGQLDRRLLVDLCADHAPVLVVDGKAIFSTPLRNLGQGKNDTGSAPARKDKLRTQRSSSFSDLASCALRSFSFTG